MHKRIVGGLAKIETIQLGNDVIVQGAGLEEVDQLFVECSLYALVGTAAAGFLGKIDEKDGLLC